MKTITVISLLGILTASLTVADVKKTTTTSDDNDACDFAAFLEAAIRVGEIRKKRILTEKEFITAAEKKGTVILDARAAEFYEQSHIKGAINLPYTHFSAAALDALIPDQSTKILIYCRNNFANEPFDPNKGNEPHNFPVKPADPEPADQSSVKPNEVKEFIYPEEYEPPELPKGVSVGLNIPTFITLYSYGYKNVWELNDVINPKASVIKFEGKAAQRENQTNTEKPAIGSEIKSEGSKPPISYKGPRHPTINLDRPDVTSVDTKGSKWCRWYIARGTRSEGSHGIITIDKKVVHGKAIYEKMTVSGREFVWYGSWDDRKNLFSTSGWLPSDLTPSDLTKWLTSEKEQNNK